MLVNQTIEECKMRENASEDDLAVFFTHDDVWPESTEGKCMFECFLEEMRIVSKLNFHDQLKINFSISLRITISFREVSLPST